MRIALIIVLIGFWSAEVRGQASGGIALDVGWGGAPSLKQDPAFRGYHVQVTWNYGWGNIGVLLTNRKVDRERTFFSGSSVNSSTTMALRFGKSWKSNYTTLTGSVGLGAFLARVDTWSPTGPFPFQGTVIESSQSFLAVPADLRMTWDVFPHLGVGVAFFGAYVPEHSYLGYHVFLRASI